MEKTPITIKSSILSNNNCALFNNALDEITKTIKLLPSFIEPEESTIIGIAVSGGIDSMVLTYIMNYFCQKNPLYQIMAVTVDHRLRLEAEEEAVLVGQWLKGLDINHEILIWKDGEKVQYTQVGLQEKARKGRYDLLLSWCKKNNISILLTAHHQQDQLETFWMRLGKGSGPKGLSCMHQATSLLPNKNEDGISRDSLTLLRPLLSWSKECIRAIAKEVSIPFIKDPSNDNTHFERVQWRHRLPTLQSLGLGSKAIGQTIRKMTDCDEMVQSLITAFLVSHVTNKDDSTMVDHTAFKQCPIFLQIGVIQHLLQKKSRAYYFCAYESARRLCQSLTSSLSNKPYSQSFTLGKCLINLTPHAIKITLENRPSRGSAS